MGDMPVLQTLARTPLHDLHLELGARMVPFAGYEMPLQYGEGIIKEHTHTRTHAGLFDVSHMGQLRLIGEGAAAALETLVPADVMDLGLHCQRYSVFTHAGGGILDDLMIANNGDHLFVVVNAACKEQDVAHLHAYLAGRCRIEEVHDHALLALQGPEAAAVLSRLAPAAATLPFMHTAQLELAGAICHVSRSGYTGEDGYEISVPADRAVALARRLLAQPEVAPIGLGARDSLRLEAGLCLYGHDIDLTTTPVEAGLAWSIPKTRRPGGIRPGGYPGASIIEKQLAEGPARQRVGLRALDRIPVREGAELQDAAGNTVGRVTSGGFGPSTSTPVAMGYVTQAHSSIGTRLHTTIRGKPIALEVAALPFLPKRFYRG